MFRNLIMFFTLWFLFVTLVSCGFETPAYRVFQYSSKGVNYGPQESVFQLLGVTYPQTQHESAQFSRKAVLIRSQDATPSALSSLRDKCSAIIILLSEQLNNPGKESDKWTKTERWLLDQEFQIPVYLCFETKEWEKLYDDLLSTPFESDTLAQLWPLANNYQLELTAPAVAQLPAARLPTLQGLLPGSGENVRTIAIVTHFDSLAIAPSLAYGVDSSGSGLIALIELARIFSSLYNQAGTEGSYNILFVVTSGAQLNYPSTNFWINQLDSRLRENIEYVFCLDSIGRANDLFYHVSKISKNPTIQRLYNVMNKTAQRMDIPFKFVQKKINLEDEVVYWEHEQFSKARILSGTLSGLPTALAPFDRLSSHDTSDKIDSALLKRNIHFLAEVLVHHLYDHHSTDSNLLDSLIAEPNELALSSWISTLGSHPRMAGFIEEEDSLFHSVQDSLSQYCPEVHRENYALKNSTGCLPFFIVKKNIIEKLI